mmetsp:Transcript_12925/g.36413  ORF Transcript_12925/g.36413 Transcript_12925/m.36413 type:complete len:209 (+) Transcript_12925:2788-3414(+)
MFRYSQASVGDGCFVPVPPSLRCTPLPSLFLERLPVDSSLLCRFGCGLLLRLSSCFLFFVAASFVLILVLSRCAVSILGALVVAIDADWFGGLSLESFSSWSSSSSSPNAEHLLAAVAFFLVVFDDDRRAAPSPFCRVDTHSCVSPSPSPRIDVAETVTDPPARSSAFAAAIRWAFIRSSRAASAFWSAASLRCWEARRARIPESRSM